MNGAGDSKGRVELFERGYGKDAAGIAREAIGYGQIQCSSCYPAILIASSVEMQPEITISMLC